MIEKINPIRAGDGLLDGIVAGLEEYLQLVPGYPGCFPAIIAKPQVLILVFLSGWYATQSKRVFLVLGPATDYVPLN